MTRQTRLVGPREWALLLTLLFTLSATSAVAQELVVRELPADIPGYDRDDWRHWVDADRDCLDTRGEVLLEESLTEVTYRDGNECTVETGHWYDPYTGQEFIQAGDLDIDHFVPLANAHRSGGWEWTREEKQQYANYLDDPGHLVAVSASANRSKGDRGPEEWWPENEEYWCEYAATWIAVKGAWGLTATDAEWWALAETLRLYC